MSWRPAQVNHYNTRSWEDYLVKHRRGGGLNVGREREESWATFNKNDETDLTIAGKLPVMRRSLERLLADDAVRRLHGDCCELYRAHVADLRRELTAAQAGA